MNVLKFSRFGMQARARVTGSALGAAAALCVVFTAAPVGAEEDPFAPVPPAEFVQRNIDEPTETAEGKPAPGTAAERLSRQKTLPPSYTEKFDLSGLPDYKPEKKVKGKIRFWGNNYIDASGLAKAWAADFKKYHPDIDFELVLPTAAIATPSLYFGLADVSMTHEPTFYDSLAHLRILGYESTGFKAITGSYDVSGWMNNMVIAVHKDNPITKITMEELDGVFGSVRVGGWDGVTWHSEYARGPEKDIRTWGQLGGKGEWADKKITPYGYSTIYSTSIEFSRRVLQSSGKWNGDFRAYGNIRNPDGTQTIQYKQIIDALKADKYGIAFVRYQKNFPTKELKFLPIAWTSKGPYYDYTMETVFNRTYPLTGEMHLWSSVKPGTKMDPKVKEFTRYVLSRQGQQLVQDVDQKYLPLNAATVKEELEKLAKF